ncbi:MAG: RrF2 family transcriptional regulator [Nitrospirae bacterium]|nr:RrF2 family transcriptional regulator [Nitrospirota bacterium]
MLRLSTKCQYGVRAMYEIARGYPETPLTIRVISERQDVSVPFLEQILGRLRKDGLIKSVKGPGGGYLLTKNPDDITIAEILTTLEGPFAITLCASAHPEDSASSKGCMKADHCVIQHLWRALGRQIEEFLQTITLMDLLKGKQFEDLIFSCDASTAGSACPRDVLRAGSSKTVESALT